MAERDIGRKINAEVGTPHDPANDPRPQGYIYAWMKQGQTVRIVNTFGSQVVDTWAFNADDPREFMSMEHSRVSMSAWRRSRALRSSPSKRRPILAMLEDTSPGVHDTTLAACDVYRYQLLGCKDYHDNCTDNLATALASLGIELPFTPCPMNLWENSRVMPDFTQVIERGRSRSRATRSTFRAEMDIAIVFSCCPQDMVRPTAPTGSRPTAHLRDTVRRNTSSFDKLEDEDSLLNECRLFEPHGEPVEP